MTKSETRMTNKAVNSKQRMLPRIKLKARPQTEDGRPQAGERDSRQRTEVRRGTGDEGREMKGEKDKRDEQMTKSETRRTKQ